MRQHLLRRLAMTAVTVSAVSLLAPVLAPAGASAAASPAPASRAPDSPVLESRSAPPVPVLHWRSCDGGFQCATARVPLNYRVPRGATISIAVIRHQATDPAHRLGSLFFNGGGPNEQIESFVAGFGEFPAAIVARYNIITFDPRGFGYSTAIRCFPTVAAENKFLGGLPAFPVGARQDAAWERTWARFDAQCAQRNGGLLDHDTTADVARDMNLLRQAVGAPVLNYIGLSYGTGLGATYANLFPTTTGRMILDGNLNPVAWTHPDGVLPIWLRQHSDQASAASMLAFLDLCGKATTAACAFSAGTPAATRAKWDTLLRRLGRRPVTIGTPPQTYTYADAVVSVPLGTVSQWQDGASVLQQLWAASAAGRPSTAASPAARAQASPPVSAAASLATRPQAAPSATAAAAPPAVYTGEEQQIAVLCSDSPNPRDPSAYATAARMAYALSGAFGLEWAWNMEACADWPAAAAQDRYAGPWNRPTASTILVLGNTGDPVLPYQDSVAMSHDLARARLLTVEGYGHTEASNPSTCATEYEIRYALTGALPPAGTVCQQDGTPFPPASGS
jgi:pimeloyl-ACP methyl ester carboxylesterase